MNTSDLKVDSAPDGKWWKDVVVYQIYPRSFMDSNGDGIGDLPGITSRLDYLRDLGVDVLWLSPVYDSPNVDNGYDIADYRAIMKEFGTMEDFDAMLDSIHSRGMRLIMDLVVNHTSDQHRWFQEARSSRDNPFRDYYIWRDPAPDGAPPNNWKAEFEGPAWTLDEKTGQYYLHLFAPQQPDLNWENAALRREVFDMMRWWFEKGIDGFRMDVINRIAKAPGLPNAPLPEDSVPGTLVRPGALAIGHENVHPFLQEMRREVLDHFDVLTVGECHRVDHETGPLYVNRDRRELDSIFQFDIMWYFQNGYIGEGFRRIEAWYENCGECGWTTITFNNHDSRRQVSALGDDGAWRKESATCIAALLLCAPGTPYMLQGEEIGMTDVRFSSIDDYNDISTVNRYKELRASGLPPSDALREVQTTSRDNGRTPMQWDSVPGGGFATGVPWLKLNPNHTTINVKEALSDPGSVLNWYRKLLALRRQIPALRRGHFRLLETGVENVYAFRRKLEDTSVAVLFNWKGTETILPSEAFRILSSESFVSNVVGGDTGKLLPWEVRIYLEKGTDRGCFSS
ncbi:alpha-glucosidase [Puniceicoccus vermicola]|uniref:Alpha-glucosidase n=1 Tax=Puniceicoccus vermicola TaxID=388746 RepID=A0A7X1E5B0_9BACT|nr:alpha-glucosidase [Puniceicoccus vermicola]MBC2602944.1 alpha-glucosidase [Puniceicoccus vermicola]